METFRPVLLRFLQTLHDSGRAELGQPDHNLLDSMRRAGTQPEEARKVRGILESWHAEAVLDLPGAPIDFHQEAAHWGAILLFRVAFLLSFREVEGSEISVLLNGERMPDEANPSAHFSADLCLRHWPVLYRMARARSEDDPLVRTMQEMARTFPLSSVGMGIAVSPDSPVVRHACLKQFFAERALERADHTCLSIPEIAGFVRSKLGAYSTTLDRGLLPPSPVS